MVEPGGHSATPEELRVPEDGLVCAVLDDTVTAFADIEVVWGNFIIVVAILAQVTERKYLVGSGGV